MVTVLTVYIILLKNIFFIFAVDGSDVWMQTIIDKSISSLLYTILPIGDAHGSRIVVGCCGLASVNFIIFSVLIHHRRDHGTASVPAR